MHPTNPAELQIEQLVSLGLTRYEAAVYLALLGRRGFTPAQAAAHSGVPRQRIYDVLASLAARGLCIERHDGQRAFHAVDPSVALPALLEDRRRQQAAELARHEAQVGALVAALGPSFVAGSDIDDPLAYIDVLLDGRRVAERALTLAQNAEREVRVCFKRPLINSAAENMLEVRAPLSRGLRYRSIYERAMLDDAELRTWVYEWLGWGQQARIVEQLPVKMNLYDDRVTLLTLQNPVTGQASFTALSITHPGFTRMQALAFERLWEFGEPLNLG